MIDAVLVERDYKGAYERLALTHEEFQNVFSAYPDMPPPHSDGDTFTLKPLVHIWYRTATVGDDAWTQFFTDMTSGLPQSDIESGNHAYIRKDLMQSLCVFLPHKSEALCKVPSLDERIQTTQANSSDMVSHTKDLPGSASERDR